MGYESTPKDTRRAWLLGVGYIILAIALGWMLFKIWPPTPWPSASQYLKTTLTQAYLECGWTPPAVVADDTSGAGSASAAQPASIPIRFFSQQCINTTFDERLILLVIVAGILGSFVHGATSLADYIGNNNFQRKWTWFYVLRPPIGMALALVFYFAVRGGFLTTSGGAQDINPYGIAALAGLVGMFSKQATDKLSEVFGTLFRSAPGEGDAKRKDSLTGEDVPSIVKIDPDGVTAGATGQTVVITGKGFAEGAVIFLGDSQQDTTFESDTQLKGKIADNLIAQAGTLKVKVVNPNKVESNTSDFVVTQ